jgi:hypothetical protein
MAIDRLLLKGGSKALATRRREKFMGMADEVEPKRLSGPAKADDTRPYSKAKLAAAAGIAGGAAAVASRDDEEETKRRSVDKEDKMPQRVAAAPREEKDDAPVRSKQADDAPAKKTGTSAFGKEFRAARDAGRSVFEFNGKKYNTMLAGESKEEHKEKLAKIKEKNEAAYEKKISELAMAKGGAVKKYAKGGVVNCGASMKPQQKWKK